MAEWKAIPDYENYEICDAGMVRNTRTQRILKPSKSRGGYEKVNLRAGGKARSAKIHRLVAEIFIPNVENKPQVNHLDGDKSNNSVTNLAWCTSSENNKHAFDTGLSYRPDTSGVPKRKVMIIETKKVFDSVSDCARFLDVSEPNVSVCISRPTRTCCGYHIAYID